ncbi:VWA domain-containing protein [Nocardioides sp. KR10-350]|uniref:vWA domain-containing protein n=1 Tax=Nocardioides cheoyonin TaxID=3156615 RepID=UPI0032B607D3
MSPGLANPALRQVLTVVRRVLIVAVMVVILVRPGWGEAKTVLHRTDLDVLVVVDRTRSMDALDGPGGKPRLSLAIDDLVTLADDLPGARFAGITFGGDVVRLELPYTTDTAAFSAFAQTIKPEGPFDGVGSRIDSPLEQMQTVLADDVDQHPDRRRIVVFVSDGENTAGGDQASFEPLKKYVDGGVVLGYGTEQGGKMLIDDERPGQGYMTDPDSARDAVSRIDTGNLRSVASQLDISFQHRTERDDASLAEAARSFRAAPARSGGTGHHEREITWVFGIVLVPLLIWELLPHRRRIREVKGLLR